MNAPALALFASAALLFAAPDASAQRSARGPSASRAHASGTVTSFTYRHGRDRDHARRVVSYCPPRRAWVPGGYEFRRREVVVPGGYERVWVPARYETRYDACGATIRVCVSVGHWKTVRRPDRVVVRRERVWVRGHWSTR